MSYLRVLVAACVVLGLVATADATVLPPCGGLWYEPAPAPIEAGRVAMRLLPAGVDGFAASLLGSDGVAIPSALEPDGAGSLLLRAMVSIPPGEYTLVYSLSCQKDPFSEKVMFVTAAPPPTEFSELGVAYNPYCRGMPIDAGGKPLVFAYPPAILITLPYAPELKPYLPFLRVTLSDDLGSGPQTVWEGFQRRDQDLFYYPVETGCNSLPNMGPANHSLTLAGHLIDEPELFRKTASTTTVCPNCDWDAGEGDPPLDAGNIAPSSADPRASSSGSCALVSATRLSSAWPYAISALVIGRFWRRRRSGVAARRAARS